MKKLIFLTSLFVFITTYGQKLSTNQHHLIKKNEIELNTLIKSKKVPNKNLYYIYLIAARDFQLANLNQYYVTYLNKAKNLETKENKAEVYWRLTNYYRKNDALVKAKALLLEWEKTRNKPDKILGQAFQLLKMKLTSTEKKLSNKEEEILERGPFSYQFKMEKLDQLIKSKHYAKALSMINKKEIQKQMISSIVRYDLLNSLVRGKKISSPICLTTYEKYRNSLSYSMKICKAIIEYNKNGNVSKSTLKETKKVISLRQYKKEKFLYDALLDL